RPQGSLRGGTFDLCLAVRAPGQEGPPRPCSAQALGQSRLTLPRREPPGSRQPARPATRGALPVLVTIDHISGTATNSLVTAVCLAAILRCLVRTDRHSRIRDGHSAAFVYRPAGPLAGGRRMG